LPERPACSDSALNAQHPLYRVPLGKSLLIPWWVGDTVF
jgi:hypothetical protein